MSRKKLALVGLGRVSRHHLDAIAANADLIELAIVCDSNAELCGQAAAKTGARAVKDLGQVRGVDIVSIATPSGLHPTHIRTLLEKSDAPAIVCEKPISLSSVDAENLFKEAKSAGKTLLPVYQNRYNPLISFVRDTIRKGLAGEVYQFCVNVFWNRNDEYFSVDWHGTKDLDGGVLYTQASHYIDMLHFFFGTPLEFTGAGSRKRGFETQDTASVTFSFPGGIVGTLNATVNAYPVNFLTEFTLIAKQGTIRLSGTNLNRVETWNVAGVEQPEMDFEISHQYGSGHVDVYRLAAQEKYDQFPSADDVISGIRVMERMSAL